MRGAVISDLHMFTERSLACPHDDAWAGRFDAVDVLVLNGDIVDFKWSIRGGPAATHRATIEWLGRLLDRLPRCTIHYVLGNHDSLRLHAEGLATLAARRPRFHWHPAWCRIGARLFHHGDLLLHPEPARHWERPLGEASPVKSAGWNALYNATVAARLHGVPARLLHGPEPVAARVLKALRMSPHPEHRGITDVYVGHTHRPFTGIDIDGVRVHNTGSSIRHLESRPLHFDVEAPS